MRSSDRAYFDVASKHWMGPKSNRLQDPNLSIGAIILDCLKKNANKIGQISHNNGIQLTNGELYTKSVRAAQHLQEMNYQLGDVIGIVAKNSEYLAPIVFAALSLGTPINTLDTTFRPGMFNIVDRGLLLVFLFYLFENFIDEIAQMFKRTMPKLVFCDDDNILSVQEALQLANISVPIFTFGKQVKGTRCVTDLFNETGTEHLFTYLCCILFNNRWC